MRSIMEMARIIEVMLRGVPIQIAKVMTVGYNRPPSDLWTKPFSWFLASPLKIRFSSISRRSVMRLAKNFYHA